MQFLPHTFNRYLNGREIGFDSDRPLHSASPHPTTVFAAAVSAPTTNRPATLNAELAARGRRSGFWATISRGLAIGFILTALTVRDHLHVTGCPVGRAPVLALGLAPSLAVNVAHRSSRRIGSFLNTAVQRFRLRPLKLISS